jgi:putative phosphonate metabolism protein
MDPMRYAVYFTPRHDHPLVAHAERWLGRSLFGREVTGEPVDGLTMEARASWIASPRRYGFHATLKAPFRLAEGCDEAGLIAGLDAFAATARPVPPARLDMENLRGFLALTFADPTPELDALAGEIVRHFDGYRAPMTAEERARRQPERLDETLRRNLDTWGYPYVFDAFRFHMTLTERLASTDAARAEEALRAHFAPLLETPVAVDRIALCREPAPGAPFACIHAAALGVAVSNTA